MSTKKCFSEDLLRKCEEDPVSIRYRKQNLVKPIIHTRNSSNTKQILQN